MECRLRILVTGGTGRIGRHAVDRLVRAGHDVVTVDRAPAGDRTPGLEPATTEVVGDAGDPALLARLMDGVDAVAHLAAIPSPVGRAARELLRANSLTTMTVLEAAGEHGVKGVALASSISILGMAWSAERMDPLALPVTETHPLRPTEGYALSKEDDEAAARMATRRWGMPTAALRFPFTETADGIEERRTDAASSESMAKELWGYLDVRDAGRAIELAIAAMVGGTLLGSSVMNVVADDVLLDRPLGELLAEWYPAVPFDAGAYPLRGAYDPGRARASIGFEAQHLLHG